MLTDRFPLFEGAAQAALVTLLLAALSAVTVEGWKLAALAGPLKRDWSSWAPFGVAFGTFQATGVVVALIVQRQTLGKMMGGFPPLLPVVTVKVGLIHAALAVLWLGLAVLLAPRRPGQVLVVAAGLSVLGWLIHQHRRRGGMPRVG